MSDLAPDEIAQLSAAEAIVSSEAFMWLMAGSNHTDTQLAALRDAYREWAKLSGGFVRYNNLQKKLGELSGT